jgi:diguanylate cyclase (GGDEF)-like protein/PAS domain S-box-containing protein
MADVPRQQLPLGGPGAVAGLAADDSGAVQSLAVLVRRIAASLDLQQTLQDVVQAVVDHLGFGGAVINLVRPGNMCEVVAAAGPPGVAQALLGTRAPMETWHKLLAACEPWGDLRFHDHRRDQTVARAIAGWTPSTPPRAAADAWHPDDLLLAPLHASGGSLIGVLSVDLPEDGRRPRAARRLLLEQFAVHAALAIENARVHTLVADSEQLFRAMFDRSPIAIALLTEDRIVTRVNAAYERLIGRAAADLVGEVAAELVGEYAAELDQREPARSGAGPGADGQYEVHFTRRGGAEVWGRVNCTLLAAGTAEDPNLVLAQIEDITLLRSAQARFAHAATHDQLTGLANRALVLERLRTALAESARAGGSVAVLFCDVDHFKEINDTLGHAAGDQLLAGIARGLQHTAREQDTVGRLGGDEFVMIAYPVAGRAAAVSLAERVLKEVSQPVGLDAGPVIPSLSVGVALSVPGADADAVLAAADRALYRAKAAGRAQWQLAGER